ncbi:MULTISPECIES: SapB/AmfS family lanthipeptide [unclassified Streptomyces]|nr:MULTISPECIES: SapB/AmfS family lanthipeptide [unclassified Streptomyces]MYZ34270.1 SapB/AmfS family lantipeptide [Streptomyces sp. SID4917]SCF65567.1 hypothetical protein GA0115259_1007510 [Streptomyces sp. MnatMP-M17]
MSLYDLQGMESTEESVEAAPMASDISLWSCGNNRPSNVSWFACG